MGKIAVAIILMAWAFSFLIMNPSLAGTDQVLPYWLTSNNDLYRFTIIIWNIGFAVAFVKFGLDI